MRNAGGALQKRTSHLRNKERNAYKRNKEKKAQKSNKERKAQKRNEDLTAEPGHFTRFAQSAGAHVNLANIVQKQVCTSTHIIMWRLRDITGRR